MKRLLVIPLAVVLILSGCSQKSSVPAQAPDYPVYITESLIIESFPQKVVSLSPAITRVIYALGAEGSLIGVSDGEDYPGAGALVKMGGTGTPDIDRMAALGTDLLLTAESLSDFTLLRLDTHEIDAVKISPVDNLSDLPLLYEAVGIILGGNESGAKNAGYTVKRIMGKINTITESIPPEKASAVLFLPGGRVATGDSFEGSLLAAAGAVNIAEGATGYRMSMESVAAANPDYIFCPPDEKEQILADPALQNTAALQNGHVTEIDTGYFSYPGDEIIHGIQLAAHVLYPDSVPEPEAV